MAKQLLAAFVSLLVLQSATLSVAAPKSGSTAFDEWLATFDPSTAVASKMISCTGKPNGFYADEPDTCSDVYYACVSGTPYAQKCSAGNVFDSTPTVGACVDRYAAASKACEAYPAPACTANNIGEFQPTAKCSDLYYICLSAGAEPIFQTCPAGEYLDPVKRVCTAKNPTACPAPVVPPKVPEYTCSDKKTTGEAYATSKCSVSFYTCTTTTGQPIPNSCTNVGAAGTVFDYTINPAAPATAASCKDRLLVQECTSSLLASV